MSTPLTIESSKLNKVEGSGLKVEDSNLKPVTCNPKPVTSHPATFNLQPVTENIAISVRNISKVYPLYSDPRDRLRQSLWYAMPKFLRDEQPPEFYKEFWALREVSFEVKRGETVGIIGRNGSGKSTLLQIIAGTLTPTGGEVQVNGRVAALLELGSGFNPEFTGRENVYLNGSILGLSQAEMDARFDDIAAFADIGQFLDQPVKLYSSGMAIRLAFSVMAHVDADILIVDEALAVGDVFFVQKCMRFLRRFCEEGTLLFVSHDTTAVRSLCQRAVWLEQGTVHALGSPKEVTDQYLQAIFAQRQPVNLEAERKTSSVAENGNTPASAQHFTKVDQAAEFDSGDQRLQFINYTQHRNDIEIGPFEPGADGFGDGRAKIVDVALLDTNDQRLYWAVGGEIVKLKITAQAQQDFARPIIGFYVRDRLGQTLFGDNTYLTTLNAEIYVTGQRHICAEFVFRMPTLPPGDYSVTAAIAVGTLLDHDMLHWIHDAVVFKSQASNGFTMGLVGISMRKIALNIFD